MNKIEKFTRKSQLAYFVRLYDVTYVEIRLIIQNFATSQVPEKWTKTP